ncbi:metal ABC transporter substrate-binding protein [Corynebacterium pseudotuberculosis]|uniref:Zinc ABC transporter solute-binding protein n=2 Tax=Bacteria TaxID=2 RepID=A0AAU8PIF8_CORPS|nr:metal ABC transporter substrate-binding protein [Corynebacterium pseudotuberculosis]AEQ05687.1 zinc ABC transporter solute-binding protein [Corynebacterium pseudotuberculosis CIP 52.97]AFB71457.1 zinc ABC transporter solute-binding protein [Corynebacterium pseudotuberculosis 316]AFK15774.1 zinc ABC transporter solute-binding protein [Corynebacterium pseudotuberculosis 258]AKP07780.1 Metal ion ABC transporter substrate-binding protein [Corynebacterium pseudotuberculosis]AKS12468.1 metal ion 
MTKESSRINRHSRRGFLAVSALTAVALLGGLSACSSEKASEKPSTLSVFATTGYIGDAVKNIAPAADVTVMVGPGGDPHTYQPTTQDISKIKTSNVVLWSGLHMEAKMLDELAAQGDRQEAVAEAIPESERLEWPELGENGEKLWDPHVWNSTENWKYVVDAIAKKLSQVDKENAETYKKNAETYKKQIDQAAAYAKEQIDAIPAEKRILITGHDAFNYFGKQFGLEIHATDFVTSESEMSPTELADLGKFIAEKKIPTIFQDNLANPQAINSLKETVRAKGWNVEVSDKELYADSLGETAPTDTYIGVLKYNADAIKAALTK